MTYLLGILLFFLGACIGSFMGVIVDPPVKKRSIWTGRSQCLSCKRTLTWQDLVPIFSYAILGGRCRTCGVKIPSSLFWLEIAMAVYFTVFGLAGILVYQDIFSTLVVLISGTFLLGLSMVDIQSFTLPDRLTIPMIAIMAILLITSSFLGGSILPTIYMALTGATIGFYFYLAQIIIPGFFSGAKQDRANLLKLIVTAPLWIIARIFVSEKKADSFFPSFAVIDDTPAWVGGGDLRLGILVGLMVGPFNFVLTVMIGYVFGSCLFLVSVLFGNKIEKLPVGPLLCIGVCGTFLLSLFGISVWGF